MSDDKQDQFFIVELFGHARIAGRISTAAIHSINWVDEAATRLAAQSIKRRPVQPYGMESTLREMTDRDRQQLLSGPVISAESNVNDDPTEGVW